VLQATAITPASPSHVGPRLTTGALPHKARRFSRHEPWRLNSYNVRNLIIRSETMNLLLEMTSGLVSHRAMPLHSGSKEFLSRVLRRDLVLRRMPLFSIICGQDSHYSRSQGYSSTPALSIEATELPNLSASSYVTNPRSLLRTW
jgi:hypothetical protein